MLKTKYQYYYSDQIKEDVIEYTLQMRIAYRTAAGKPEGKKKLRRPRCRWKDNIKMALNTFAPISKSCHLPVLSPLCLV
jgi:hypothetical protein